MTIVNINRSLSDNLTTNATFLSEDGQKVSPKNSQRAYGTGLLAKAAVLALVGAGGLANNCVGARALRDRCHDGLVQQPIFLMKMNDNQTFAADILFSSGCDAHLDRLADGAIQSRFENFLNDGHKLGLFSLEKIEGFLPLDCNAVDGIEQIYSNRERVSSMSQRGGAVELLSNVTADSSLHARLEEYLEDGGAGVKVAEDALSACEEQKDAERLFKAVSIGVPSMICLFVVCIFACFYATKPMVSNQHENR